MKDESSSASEVNVVNVLGVWALVRDGLIENSDQVIPTALKIDFVRFRKSAANASVDSLQKNLDELDASYDRLRKRFHELPIKAFEYLKGKEKDLLNRAIQSETSRNSNNSQKFAAYINACLHKPEGSFSQLYAGAIIRCLDVPSSVTNPYAMGAALSGPLFFGFIHRLLLKARSDGIERIYFMARDGCLLVRMAKILNASLDLGLDLRYLRTSRQATRFPSIFRLTTRDFVWIFERMDTEFTLQTLASRLQTDVKGMVALFSPKVRTFAEQAGSQSVLGEEEVNLLKDEFLTNQALAQDVEKRAAEYRASVSAYYRQEGIFEKPEIALVDIGWLGSLQDALYRILRDQPDCPRVTEYYFGCSQYSEDTMPSNRKIPFFLFPSKRTGFGPLMELILLADHGMTLGYKRSSDGGMLPICNDAGAHLADWGLQDYFAGACDFTHVYAESLQKFGDLIEPAYDAVVPELIHLLRSAEPVAAITFGDILYSGNQEEDNLRAIAPPFTAVEALRYIFGSKASRQEQTQWGEASIKRSSRFVRFILFFDLRPILTAIREVVRTGY
ncbi:MAG: hypothetical protein AAF546_05105 [Verrucomicrobiota bacterium]